jgi:UDP:flavonoid glycosyltransferase YjiC (YdhE family)
MDAYGNSRRILVAPLNWGLGHATRCIPIIRLLLERGVQVYLASDGEALRLLKAEFPDLPAMELPSYRIRYGHGNMVLNIGRQLPRLVYAIRAEQWATERLVSEYGIQGIISDNRYGCFSKHTRNVLMTHQLNLRVPGWGLQWCANKILGVALRKFQTIWVPDLPGAVNLSGALSHGPELPHPDVQYIGLLSRMRVFPQELEYDLAFVLSGPEPQRSFLEQRLMEQAVGLPYRCIFVQGKMRSREHYFESDQVEVVSHLTTSDLNRILLASAVVVCRSGYSSMMDLAVLNKKAILIPTPGQTEQEYLADLWEEAGCFAVQSQENIDLEKGMEAVKDTWPLDPHLLGTTLFHPVLDAWLKLLA